MSKCLDVLRIFDDGFCVRDGNRLVGKPHYLYRYWTDMFADSTAQFDGTDPEATAMRKAESTQQDVYELNDALYDGKTVW